MPRPAPFRTYCRGCFSFFCFFNDTATTEIYTLSLHDALPIYICGISGIGDGGLYSSCNFFHRSEEHTSELQSPYVISYAVFCLKKKYDAVFIRTQMLVFGRVIGMKQRSYG